MAVIFDRFGQGQSIAPELQFKELLRRGGTQGRASGIKQSRISRTLDIISAPLSQPRITLSKGLRAGGAAVRQRRLDISAGRKGAGGVIGTTLGTTALAAGGILALSGPAAGGAGITARGAASAIGRTALANKRITSTLGAVGAVALLAPKTTKKFASTPGAGSVLLATAINPIAGLIVGLEKGTGLIRSGIENVTEGLSTPAKTALGIGTGLGVLGGAALLGKTLVSKAKGKIGPTISTGAIPSTGAGALVQSSQSAGVIAKPKEETKTPTSAAQPIRITNKPEINIAIAG